MTFCVHEAILRSIFADFWAKNIRFMQKMTLKDTLTEVSLTKTLTLIALMDLKCPIALTLIALTFLKGLLPLFLIALTEVGVLTALTL